MEHSRPPISQRGETHGDGNSAPHTDRGQPDGFDAIPPLQEVKRLAGERPTTFCLLIPSADPNKTADWSLATATKLLGRAAGTQVEAFLGGQDPFESIKEAVGGGHYDDVLISTLPKRRSDWLRKDLPTRVETLGLPVSVITPPEEPSPLQQFTDTFSARSD